MKFRIVLKTKTPNDNDLVLKLNVPPSKHQGLVNFLKMATKEDNPNNNVAFTIEMIGPDKKKVESTVQGNFKFEKSAPSKKD